MTNRRILERITKSSLVKLLPKDHPVAINVRMFSDAVAPAQYGQKAAILLLR